MKLEDMIFIVGFFFVTIVLIGGGGWILNKAMDNDMIVSHMERGANFAQAYCATHEPDPRTIHKCVDSYLNVE